MLHFRVAARSRSLASGTRVCVMSTFVSKHNHIGTDDIRSYLSKIEDMSLKESKTHFIVKDCSVMPDGFCLNPQGTERADNQNKVYVLKSGVKGEGGGGTWFCHRCQSKGSWYDLKRLVGGQMGITHGLDAASASQYEHAPVKVKKVLKLPNQRIAASYPVMLMNSNDPSVALIRDYLTVQRGLKMEILMKYGVGVAAYDFPEGSGYVEKDCVTFPWLLSRAELEHQDRELGTASELAGVDANQQYIHRRIKARAWQQKSCQRLDPSGGGWGLFGLQTVPEDCTSVVLTEGEYDAMAVFQGTGMPAISLPNGAGSLPIDVLPLLERFERIYLWMDDDAPGQAGCEKFARKLGMGRCHVVRPLSKDLDRHGKGTLKDANDCLLLKVDMKAMLEAAELPTHHHIATFKNLRDQVLHEIRNPDEYCGVPVRDMPLFTKIIKGVRKGELSIFTGSTGAGKTTFLSQLSLDLAQQGVNTLWGSFEIKNTRLLKKMIQQFHKLPLQKPGSDSPVEGIEVIADRFQALPLHFLTFHGGSEVDQVIDAMDFAVYAYDVEHVIIDNLQFMLSRVGRKEGGAGDKFDQQDLAIEKFRRFATAKNVHVTLVVHPRKEDEGVRLGLASIFGSAKATQEADSVVILQNDGEIKYLDVRKNRFDGALGIVPLSFSPGAASFYEDLELGKTLRQRLVAAASTSSYGRR